MSKRRCTSCGRSFTDSPDIYREWCPECRICEACGSGFMIRRIVEGTTEGRCLSCLHYTKASSTAIAKTLAPEEDTP